MEPDLQTPPVQNTTYVPPTEILSNKSTKFLPLIIVGFLMLLLGLLGGYILFANKNQSAPSSLITVKISPTSVPSTPTDQPSATTTPVKTNISCGKEGTVADATIFDQTLGVDNRPKEVVTSKKWENDAYLVAEIKYNSFHVPPTDQQIYASSCTTDYLVYHSAPGGDAGGYRASASIVTSNDLTKSIYQPNLLQFPYNQSITDIQATEWNVEKIPNFPWLTIKTSDTYDSKDVLNTINNVSLNGNLFNTDGYALQLNNSKKFGVLYDLIFIVYTGPSGSCSGDTCIYKVTALATADQNGKLLSFKKY